MKRSPNEFRLFPVVFISALLVVAVVPSALADPDFPGGGRFLYAGDDDWDWASPLGTAMPCKLSKYGDMPWSALDSAEEGLKVVRGVFVGLPPMVEDYSPWRICLRCGESTPPTSTSSRRREWFQGSIFADSEGAALATLELALPSK